MTSTILKSIALSALAAVYLHILAIQISQGNGTRAGLSIMLIIGISLFQFSKKTLSEEE